MKCLVLEFFIDSSKNIFHIFDIYCNNFSSFLKICVVLCYSRFTLISCAWDSQFLDINQGIVKFLYFACFSEARTLGMCQ